MNKLKEPFLLFFFVLSTLAIFAQREANIWYFGHGAGLDFNSGAPVALTDGQIFTDEGCATISDGFGNLLFYTNGILVWNKDHKVMFNGTGLLGNDSSTHSAIIVPKPNSLNIYYIFTVDFQGAEHGLNYSEVNMDLDGGLGGITSIKNIQLFTPVTEKITAIKNPKSNNYWVVSHKFGNNEFISYEISSTGVSTSPIISPVGSSIIDVINYSHYAAGAIKISPSGEKLAVARVMQDIQVFDFNSETGIVSQAITLNDVIEDFYGIEFSPNGELLYVTKSYGVYQFNLKAGSEQDIIASEIKIADLESSYGALQLATDGKIYVAILGRPYLDAINNPNNIGLESNYKTEAIYLEERDSRYGLPPFIQSYFSLEKDIGYTNVCYGDATEFFLNDAVNSVVWDFGDPASGSNNTSTDFEPTHVFINPGMYEISVTATVGGNTAIKTTTLTIYQQPIATKPHDILMCDLLGDITFDLKSQSVHVLNGLDPDIFGVNYYEGMANYTNGIKIDQPEAYTNALSFYTQEIIAEVYNKQNSECTDVTEFNVGIFKTPQLETNINLSSLIQCDDSKSGSDSDGITEFDLTVQEQYLLLNGVASEVHYNYFTDAAMSLPIVSPSRFVNTQTPQTIYVEGVSYANQCKTTTSFIIETIELPSVTPVVELKQCDEDLDGFFSAFNLNEVINKITSNAANEIVAFYESEADAENNNNPIINSTTYSNQTPSSDIVWARVENNNGCFRTSRVNLIVTTTQIPNTFIREFYVCDGDTDGVSQFDFSSVNNEIEGMFPIGQQVSINYYRNEANALAEENKIDDISNYSNVGYPNTQQIYVRVDSKVDNDCLGLGAHINLYVESQPIAHPVTIERQCDDNRDGEFPFDVSLVESTLLNGQSLSNVTVTYNDENNNLLPSPLPNPFLTTSQTITIRVTNNNVVDGSCYAETLLEFIVDAQPIANPVANQFSCDDGIDDADGLHEFDTTLIESTILNGQTGMVIHYYDSIGTELSSPLPNPFNSTTQTISVEVVNPENPACTDTTEIDFIVNPLPEFSIEPLQIICSSDPTFTVLLDPQESDISEVYRYEWLSEDGSLLSIEPTLTVSTPGLYSITLTKTNGTACSRTRNVFVNASELATITIDDITIVDVSNNNTITIDKKNLGQGDYEFALDYEFSLYQDEPSFSNVSSGEHTIYVRDKKGCGTSSIDISVIGFPKYFTPNGDGIHDYWQIDGANSQVQAKIFIYDRYGKLLKQLSPSSKGWDGTFNGKMLPTDDYWFKVLLDDGREFMNHFTLKR
ncbi:T9SS type B sorting domain-containing protein [Gelidibacter gilvus]|uniref:T9SS type B sorting domain-containing protein n=1 Tax=Gelidibacter gilvus TaxID=59602 RepID=A0A4Q0XK33_9FLAO|nr:T9SS type B sorting domain-containing protein [Gelidibacter gilvus]RXJ51513.1 T9SS type B sorting domain-containing protein [Gelidibacter gilvus]